MGFLRIGAYEPTDWRLEKYGRYSYLVTVNGVASPLGFLRSFIKIGVEEWRMILEPEIRLN